MKAEKKQDVNGMEFPNIDLFSYKKSTNEVLKSCVSQQKDISELIGSSYKQNFAKEGMSIHEHKAGERCAFCGKNKDSV